MKKFNIKIIAVFISVLCLSNVYALDQGSLSVTSITPTQTLATPDGNFDNGWQWIFNVTVPTNETALRMKFADWTSGTSTIPTNSNVRIYSPQSINANSTSTAKILTGASVYGDMVYLSPSLDLSNSLTGRQIQVVVDVRVPSGTGGGSYASSYGVSSDLDPNQLTGTISYIIDPTYQNISINRNQTQQIIGQVLVTANNEDVKLNTLRFDPKFFDSNINPSFTGLSNMKFFVNGTAISDLHNWTLSSGGAIQFNINPDVILPVGQQKTLTLKSDINFNSNLNNSTGTLNTVIGGITSNAQGVTTNRLISVFAIPFNVATTTLTNNFPLASLSIADFPNGNTDQPSSVSLNVGSLNQTLWSRNIAVQNHPININYIKLKLIGSVPPNALANVKLYTDGLAFGVEPTLNSSNQYVFENINSRVLSTGSHVIELRGDIVNGQNRSFYISLEQASDLSISDNEFNQPINVTTNNGQTIGNLNGGTVSINGGSLTINQDSTFTNNLLISGATSSKMAAFKFTAFSEDLRISSLTFHPVFTGLVGGNNLANIGLYINGIQIGSNTTAFNGVDITFSGLGSSLYIPVGQLTTVEIRGDVTDSLGNPISDGTVVFNLSSGSNNVVGVASSQAVNSPGVSGQSMSLANANVTYTGSGTFTKNPNTSQVKIGSFIVQVNSAESIRLNQLKVILAGSVDIGNQINNLTVKNGSTIIGTPIGNPVRGENNFSTSFNLPSSSFSSFDVYADLGSIPNGLNLTVSSSIVYVGNTSNQTNTKNTGSYVTTNVGLPSITSSEITFNTTNVGQIVIGGTTLNIGTYNIKTNNNIGGAILKDLTFSSASNVITSITINGKTAAFVGNSATIYNVGIEVPASSDGVNIPVTVSLACVNPSQGCSGTAASLARIQNETWTYYDGNNIQTISVNSTRSGQSGIEYYVYGSRPTVTANNSVQSGLSNGDNKIGTVTVAADAAGRIKINDIKFTTTVVTGNTGSITSPRLVSFGTTISGSTCSVTGVSPGSPTVGTPIIDGEPSQPPQPIQVGILCHFGSGSHTDGDGFSIAAGTSFTFDLYASISGVNGSAGTNSVITLLGTENAPFFNWDDVNGNVTNIDGQNINNFPTESYVKRN